MRGPEACQTLRLWPHLMLNCPQILAHYKTWKIPAIAIKKQKLLSKTMVRLCSEDTLAAFNSSPTWLVLAARSRPFKLSRTTGELSTPSPLRPNQSSILKRLPASTSQRTAQTKPSQVRTRLRSNSWPMTPLLKIWPNRLAKAKAPGRKAQTYSTKLGTD